MPIWSDIYILYSSYFIFCRYLHYNEITSIQSGTRREKKKGWTYNQYKTTTSIFIHDTIDEDNKANIQLKIYTLPQLTLSFILAFNCIYGIFSLNNSLFKDYVSPMFLLEFDLTETNYAARPFLFNKTLEHNVF
jgi:hypothetical protein